MSISSSETSTERVYQALRGQLTSGAFEPRQRLPSFRRLAETFGTSKSTIQTAVQRLQYEGLIEAEHGRGIFAADRPTRLQRFVLIAPTLGHEFADYTHAFVQHLGASCDISLAVEHAERGQSNDGRLTPRLEAHLAGGVDAIVFNGMLDCDLGFLQQLADRTRLLCFYGDDVIDTGFACDRVLVDWRRGGAMAIEHLVQRGCRSIVVLVHSVLDRGFQKQLDDGVRDAAARCGVEILVHTGSPNLPGYADRLCKFLADHPRVDGMFATADYRIALVLPRVKAMGRRVPEDLAIVGFYNTPHSEATDPPLTTFSTRPDAIAEAAGDLLSQPSSATRVMIAPELIARQSTDRPSHTRSARVGP